MSTAIRKLSVLESAFLFAETAECPMHVGSLTILKLPEGYSADFYEDVKARFLNRMQLAKSLRYKVSPAPFDIDRPSWVEDEHFDIDRHVLRASVPAPGDRATLLRLVGWMHAMTLNRARPLWEFYIFDDLPNGEAAIYTKMHHAFIDGGAGAALTEILYDHSPNPPADGAAPPAETEAERKDIRDLGPSLVTAYANLLRPPEEVPEQKTLRLPRAGGNDLGSVLFDALIDRIEWRLRLAASAPDIARALASTLQSALKPRATNVLRQLSAPSTPLNKTITSERSFATVTLPLARVKAVGAKVGGKVNEVILAISAGVLRRNLLERDALPKATLTAMVPISAHDPGSTELNNQTFAMTVPLGTDIADRKERLERIVAESQLSKEFANPLRPLVGLLDSVPTFGTPMALELLATLYSRSNLANVFPPAFNLVVSNVLVSKRPFFIGGAEMIHLYPMNIVVHGQGLSITVLGYRDGLDFGLIAGGEVLPHLGRFAATFLEELEELERAVGA